MGKKTGAAVKAVESTESQHGVGEHTDPAVPRPGELKALFDAYKQSSLAIQAAEQKMREALAARSKIVEAIGKFGPAFDTDEGKLFVMKRTVNGATTWFFRGESSTPAIKVE